MNEVDYAAIFEALPSPFMLLDAELRYVAANKAYLETTGRSLDELRGQYVMDMFPNPGESGARLLASFQQVVRTCEPHTLAYLPYPIAESDGSYSNRYWTCVHVPILDARGEVAFIMQNTVDVTEFARLREAASLPFHSLSAATRLIERTREAEAASADFRRLFQQAPGFFAVLSGPRHIFTFASDSYVRLVGGRAVVGRAVAEALPEIVDQGFVELLDRVYRDGYIHQAESAQVMLVREPGQSPEETFLDFSYHPIRDADGAITGVFVQGMDRTESFRFARRQRLLIDELNHRVKNTLATVLSIASQTLRKSSDSAARQDFEARIIALSKAHTMLSERQWHATEIGEVVRQELGAHDRDHVHVEGPAIPINAKATVAMALVLHELATNAAKHGALSVPDGRVVVTWSLGPDDAIVMHWAEHDGPPVRPPERSGFGSRLLRTVITGELGGALDCSYDEGGFSARLAVPSSAYCVKVDHDA